MPVIAKLNYLRIAPRKVRLVINLIQGKTDEEAQSILNFTTKKAAKVFLKLLKSAIANAKNNFQLEESNLYISKITVNEGPKYKRYFPRARGKADEIQKKTSHITIALDEIRQKPQKPKQVKKIEEIKKIEEVKKAEKPKKIQKEKLRTEIKIKKPKIEKSSKRMFRRTAF